MLIINILLRLRMSAYAYAYAYALVKTSLKNLETVFLSNNLDFVVET